MKIGKCKLCDRECELIKQSHIIPEFMYKPLYNKHHRYYEFSIQSIVKNKELTPLRNIGEFEKYILCQKCDNELLGTLESYASKILNGTNKRTAETPICTNYNNNGYEFSECKNIDYTKFKLFLLSILWRAHITSRDFFKNVDLGDRHANRIKEMLISGNAGEEDEYPLIVMSTIRAKSKYKDVILTPLKEVSKDGVKSYIFSIGAFKYQFYVNSPQHKLPPFVKEFRLKKDNSLKIIQLKDGMENILIHKIVGGINKN